MDAFAGAGKAAGSTTETKLRSSSDRAWQCSIHKSTGKVYHLISK
jgi:hypothetical protein